MAMTLVLSLARPERLSEEYVHALSTDLSPEETARLRSLPGSERRESFLLGRSLVRRALARVLDRPPQSFSIFAERYEKPQLVGGGADFSISHCRSHVLVGVTTGGSIGVDVEEVDRFDDRLARRLLSASELDALVHLDPRGRQRAVAGLWTSKEASAKVSGGGLGKLRSPELVSTYESRSLDPGPGVVASVAGTFWARAPLSVEIVGATAFAMS